MCQVNDRAKRLSIIIPARNEEAQVGRTVQAVLSAEAWMEGRPAEQLHLDATHTEVIVVDNNSNDGTQRAVEPFVQRHGVRVVHCKTLGAARARNVGALHARGEVLVFVDADTWIPKEGLQRIDRLTREGGFRAGIFRLAAQRGGLRARCWWAFWNNVRCLPLARAKALPAFMFCTRQVFEQYGPFDEAVAIGEEWPILARLWHHDAARLIYDRSLTGHTSGRRMDLQPFGYLRTCIRYGLAILCHGARVNYTDAIRENGAEPT